MAFQHMRLFSALVAVFTGLLTLIRARPRQLDAVAGQYPSLEISDYTPAEDLHPF
jgi:hypothetical protein